MLRNDGAFKFYIIEHKQKKTNDWVRSNLDVFGHPEGFNASGACWQQTGVIACFDEQLARKGLGQVRVKNPEYEFRISTVFITQLTIPSIIS